MSFDSSPRHLKLVGDLGVVTTLQKQFDDLLFARTQPNSLLLHPNPPFLTSPPLEISAWRNLSNFIAPALPFSVRDRLMTPELHFPQAVAGIQVALREDGGASGNS
jgi:hypothetical protein